VAIGLTGKRIEAGLFGRDGMSGLPIVMGDDRSPHEAFMQGAGSGHRIEADALREAMAADPVIRDRFLRFVQFSAVQVAATALANGQNTVEARLARWLLTCHDRTGRDLLDLTHELVALMLGCGARASPWRCTCWRAGG
jgi:CRP-like cAMP-binding protein